MFDSIRKNMNLDKKSRYIYNWEEYGEASVRIIFTITGNIWNKYLNRYYLSI